MIIFRFFICLIPVVSFAQESLNIAVTASFKPVLEALAEPFEAQTNINLNISSASTGVLYQQVLSGAPFDIFFAADDKRPALLSNQLSINENNLRIYAVGKLVLVVNGKRGFELADLSNYQGRVVIANPTLAPYGIAAKKVLQEVGFGGQLVLANNVTQARQYLVLGLAEVGLIAASVAQDFEQVTEIDATKYDVINQQLLVIKPSDRAQSLLTFLNSAIARDIIRHYGYELPEL